jgi:hypothetical protein
MQLPLRQCIGRDFRYIIIKDLFYVPLSMMEGQKDYDAY